MTADPGWQGTLLAHIRHSRLGRETFEERYPDAGEGGVRGPVDGWFGATAHRFRVGVSGARILTDRFALRLSAGSLFSIQKQGLFLSFAHGQVPVYLETSVRAGW